MSNSKPNKEIIYRLKNGDMLAFDEIYQKYCPRLFGFVLKLIKQESDAEEIVQEVFVKIWESRAKIGDYSTFDSFLFTIAHNQTISLLRKRVNEKKYLDHLQAIRQITSSNEITDEIHYNELKDKIQSVVDQLTPRQKEIYLLSREAGLTYNEIAKKLNISTNTVENHMVNALSFLKKSIDKSLLINLLFISLFI